jgi:hypothetical protein
LRKPRRAPDGRGQEVAAAIAFYGLNGRHLTLTNDAACDLVMGAADRYLDSIDEIAAVLRQAIQVRLLSGAVSIGSYQLEKER